MAVRGYVRRVAEAAFGAEIVPRPVLGFEGMVRRDVDNPLAGVSAARLVIDVACGQLREFARRARGEGASWADVADALGLDDGPGDASSRAGSAYEWLVEHRPPEPRSEGLPSPSSAIWTCSTCGERVRDTGPYESHPDDNEAGHAEACARRRAAVATWRRSVGEDH